MEGPLTGPPASPMPDDLAPTALRVLWRVVIPVALVALVAGATHLSLQRRDCHSLCAARHFADARFTPAGHGSPALCHCLTAAEAAVTGRVPEGTQVFP